MNRFRTCLACGVEGWNVAMCLVELAPDRQCMVEVRLPAAHRAGAVEIVQTVPERYVAEPRCRDKTACIARVRALL